MKGDNFAELEKLLSTSLKDLQDQVKLYSAAKEKQAKINSWFSPIAVWISIAVFIVLMVVYPIATKEQELGFILPVSVTGSLVPLISFAARSNLTIQRSNSELQAINSRIQERRNEITLLRLRMASAEADERSSGSSNQRQRAER